MTPPLNEIKKLVKANEPWPATHEVVESILAVVLAGAEPNTLGLTSDTRGPVMAKIANIAKNLITTAS